MGRTVKDLEAVIYVPSSTASRSRSACRRLIAPRTVKQEEFGMMLGRVTYVSDFPATSRGMRRVLKNDKLITGLAGSDAPYEVHADLLVDASTASKYKWSSSQGPPLRIQSGTLAVAHVTVASRRPSSWWFPSCANTQALRAWS
jgi:HlyD family secretion protein